MPPPPPELEMRREESRALPHCIRIGLSYVVLHISSFWGGGGRPVGFYSVVSGRYDRSIDPPLPSPLLPSLYSKGGSARAVFPHSATAYIAASCSHSIDCIFLGGGEEMKANEPAAAAAAEEAGETVEAKAEGAAAEADGAVREAEEKSLEDKEIDEMAKNFYDLKKPKHIGRRSSSSALCGLHFFCLGRSAALHSFPPFLVPQMEWRLV
jgi:hypothetical protein